MPSFKLPDRLALPALILANCALACAPWLVRLSWTEGGVGPVGSAFWRIALAMPVFAALLPVYREALPTRWLWAVIAALVAGLLFAGNLAAWYTGVLQTRMSNATLLCNLAAFIFAIYGFIAARSWPRARQWLALAFALGGTLLLLGRSYQMSATHLVGDLLCVGAGACYGFYLVAVERARSRLGPLTTLLLTGVGAAPALLFVALAIGDPIRPSDWTPLLLMTLSSQLIGQGLILWAVSRVTPLVIGLMLLIQPVVASAIGWIVYGERLDLLDLIGAVAILGAILLVRDRPLQPRRKSLG